MDEEKHISGIPIWKKFVPLIARQESDENTLWIISIFKMLGFVYT